MIERNTMGKKPFAPRITLALALNCFLGATVFSAVSAETSPTSPFQLTDVTNQTGIDFVHTDGSSGRRYIVESVASGLALFDYDRDGDIDIYFLNGSALPGTEPNVHPTNRLYRNEGRWRFTDVTAVSGVGDTGYGLGVCTGDFDNDGHTDLFINNFGANRLYRNQGDGTFDDVTAKAGVGGGNHVGSGACFLDIENDGDLDLFIGRYVDFTFETHKTSTMNGYPSYVGPLNYPPISNLLYRNNGDGTFTDISEASGIAQHKASGMGAICADYDNDGDTDIFVGNDLAANFLFENDGKGYFQEVALLRGLAYDSLGTVHGTMAVECFDWNHDGLLDFYTTSYQRQLTTLYQNSSSGYFDDVTRKSGAGESTYPQVTWGAGVIDLDNDADRDLFIACGHLIDNVEKFDDTTSYKALNLVLENNGQGQYLDRSQQSGNGMLAKASSRGAAFDDLDNDGDLDVVILNAREAPTLLRNDSPHKHHWIQIQLQGTESNRSGIGARVQVVNKSRTLTEEVRSGRSYQSDFGRRLHFGLGSNPDISQVTVRWPHGAVDVVKNPKSNQVLTIVEGKPR